MVFNSLIFISRWFAFDTIVSVMSVQLFLMTMFNQFSLRYLFGLSFVTVLFYMIDRLIDLKFTKSNLNQRHFIYRGHSLLLVFSLSFLFLISFLFWLTLDSNYQFKLLVAFLLFVAHIFLNRYSFYSFFKSIATAIIFTYVMTVFYHLNFPSWLYFFIFFVTLLNLNFHEWMETEKAFHRYTFIFISIMTLALSFQLSFLVVCFCLFTISGYLILRYFSQNQYWFELGELLYSFPFIMYVLFN